MVMAAGTSVSEADLVRMPDAQLASHVVSTTIPTLQILAGAKLVAATDRSSAAQAASLARNAAPMTMAQARAQTNAQAEANAKAAGDTGAAPAVQAANLRAAKAPRADALAGYLRELALRDATANAAANAWRHETKVTIPEEPTHTIGNALSWMGPDEANARATAMRLLANAHRKGSK
jgi:hypothetical protein